MKNPYFSYEEGKIKCENVYKVKCFVMLFVHWL